MTEKLISLVNFTTERSGHGFKQGVAHPRLCNHVQMREREGERERERERERDILHACQKNNQLC